MRERAVSELATAMTVPVDFSRVGDRSVRGALEQAMRELGYRSRRFRGLWSALRSGDLSNLPAGLVVIADLTRLEKAFSNTREGIWRTFVRRTHPLLMALVRGRLDAGHADRVDELLRASESRVWVYAVPKVPGASLREQVAEVLEHTDPEAVIEVRYSEAERLLWVEFADGFKRPIRWAALGLDEVRPTLRPETIRVGRHPETLEVLDARGGTFEIDTAAVRSVADRRWEERQDAVSESAALSLGDRLRRRREGDGLTQEELAKRTGLTQEMISNLERGKHRPRLDTLERYARGLGLSVPVLLGT